MADLGIIFLRRKHTIHWYKSLFTVITGSMPFRYFWATLYIDIYILIYIWCMLLLLAFRSWKTIEFALMSCQFVFICLRSSTCCCCTCSPIFERQTRLQVVHITMFVGSVGTDLVFCLFRALLSSTLSSLLFSLVQMASFMVCLHVTRSSTRASRFPGEIFPAIKSRLQTSLKRRRGLPVDLEPVASSPNRMSLGILASCIRLTWPSQIRLFESKANMLGILAWATTLVFETRSCRVMPSILLRQRRWKTCQCSCQGKHWLVWSWYHWAWASDELASVMNLVYIYMN